MVKSCSGILAQGSSQYPRYMYGEASLQVLVRAFNMEERCHRYNVPLAAVALQFSLWDVRVTSTIVGIT
jgi:D-threo-aldose 1-dehydrogenase